MGQYHKTCNVTKKQYIHPHHMNCGFKLMEQVGFEKSPADALFLLLANSNGRGGGDANKHPLIGSWAGDSIVVQGDYAEAGDPGFIPEDDLDSYIDITQKVVEMLNAAGY